LSSFGFVVTAAGTNSRTDFGAARGMQPLAALRTRFLCHAYVTGASTADGALVEPRTRNGQSNQQWILV
jgi:hypothetical protein